MREQETFTYDGRTGRVTRPMVLAISQEEQISPLEEEDEEGQESPFFHTRKLERAIVNHVMHQVQQSQQ